jgi:predicted transposase/invertase (TIGR01784 family)
MTKLEHLFKDDLLCKMLFVKYPVLLQRFVARILRIAFESIEQFIITNPEIPPENLGDKFCRFDIHMIVNGQRVDLEVQVNSQSDYIERSEFYRAKSFSSALPEGEDYSLLPRTIVISIVDFILFKNPNRRTKYHSIYGVLELECLEELSGNLRMHYFELPKLPKIVDENDILQLWLSLFKAETEEELSKIKALGVDEMEQAIGAYQSIAVSPEYREAARLR